MKPSPAQPDMVNFSTGVIAAGHPQTAAAGAEMLRLGGNAVDAAVAATFASFVAEPALVNIGGGGMAQIFNPARRQATVFDFFSNMPGISANGSRPSSGLDFRQVLIDFGTVQQPFYIGRGSVAVPGVVAGLGAMLETAGTLPLATILQPAMRLAQAGVRLSPIQANFLHLLEPIINDTPGLAAIFTAAGRLPREGETLRFPELAHTLDQLGRQGSDLFCSGAVATKIVADQRANGGLISEADLSGYQVYHTTPLKIVYRGYTILLPSLSSGGGVLIAFALKLLHHLSLANIQHGSFDHIRLLTEVMRFTSLARAEWEQQLDQSPFIPNQHQARLVTPFLAEANVTRFWTQLQQVLAGKQPQPVPIARKGPANTTHLTVADKQGMVAAVTTSAGECAGFVVADTGVTLNNMLGEIDLHRNGFHRLPAGQRLMTMMSPTLILKEGLPVLAVGSGGSNRIRSAILQVISNVIDFDMPLAEAVDAPRLHFEDNELQLEGGVSAESAAQMKAAGYDVTVWPERNMFFGGSHAVGKDGYGQWVAAGDKRRGGAVVEVS